MLLSDKTSECKGYFHPMESSPTLAACNMRERFWLLLLEEHYPLVGVKGL